MMLSCQHHDVQRHIMMFTGRIEGDSEQNSLERGASSEWEDIGKAIWSET